MILTVRISQQKFTGKRRQVLFDQSALEADRVTVTDQDNSDRQLRIHQ
jgi:hypothetical protein